MIISCPACATRFNIDLSVLGDRGRKVRCAGCGHVWHQTPPGAEPDDIAARHTPEQHDSFLSDMDFEEDDQAPPPPAAAGVAAASSGLPPLPGEQQAYEEEEDEEDEFDDDDDDFDDEEDEEDEFDDDDDFDDEFDDLDDDDDDRRPGGAGKIILIVLGALVGLGLIGSVAAIFLARDTVTAAIPGMDSFYEAIGMKQVNIEEKLTLQHTQINSDVVQKDGRDVQIYEITGEVVNMSPDEAIEVPTLRAVLLDGAGSALNSWTFEAETRILRPGEKTIFQTSVTDPAPNASDVRIKFDLED